MTADERLALIRRKVERAETHFENLKTVKNGFFKSFIEGEAYTIGSQPDSKLGHEGLSVFFPTSLNEIDPSIALMAGDILHSLRSALDHLACHLVQAAGKPVSDQVMFPIFRGDKIDEPSFSRKVEGMSNAAKD